MIDGVIGRECSRKISWNEGVKDGVLGRECNRKKME